MRTSATYPDPDVWEWLQRRQLDDAFMDSSGVYRDCFGVLSRDDWGRLSCPTRRSLRTRGGDWLETGHRIVAPLFSTENGQLRGIQARSIFPDVAPKTVAPVGCATSATAFATEAGRLTLRGEWIGWKTVVVGEGATDALTVAGCELSVPAIFTPGASQAGRALGPWAAGWLIVAAFDADQAGRQATEALRRSARGVGATGFVVLDLPDGNDLSDVRSGRTFEEFRQFLERGCDVPR